MAKVRSTSIQLLFAICGIFTTLYGLRLFSLWLSNQNLLMTYLLMKVSLPFRMILNIVTQWLLFLVPGVFMIVHKEKFGDIGFVKKKIPMQIGIGVLLAFSMSLILTVLPIFLGFKDMVGNTTYTQVWEFVYEFIHSIFGVAVTEELIFRGYIFYKLLEIKNSKWFAIIISSVLFGLYHVFNGHFIQIVMATVIGFIFCFFREKLKGCTLLSLIIAHGVYDALITLWVSIL